MDHIDDLITATEDMRDTYLRIKAARKILADAEFEHERAIERANAIRVQFQGRKLYAVEDAT